MNDDKPSGAEAGISTRTMEIAVALVLFAVGALVVTDSYRLGSKWGSDGPQSGYFPFYIGLLLCIASVATLVEVAITHWRRRQAAGRAVAERMGQFVTWGQLKLVLSVLSRRSCMYWASSSSASTSRRPLYIALFMRLLGTYSWLKSVAIGVIVSA